MEARSPRFSESLKIDLQKEIKTRRPSDTGAFPRGADLLIFFYELSLRLLNEKGYNFFITENSWLSTDYGKAFQKFLLKKGDIHAIIDSEYKYFETADINTVITIFKNKHDENSCLPVKFFHCNGSLEKFSCNTIVNHDIDKVSLKLFSPIDQLLHTYKWSVIIKADVRLLQIMESLYRYEDKVLSEKISIGQGLNLTKSHFLKAQFCDTLPIYTSDIGPTYSWESSLCYVHKQWISNNRKTPKLILPRGIGTHFCSVNNCSGYSSSYVEVYGELSEEEVLNIWLFCNSSLCWLLREIIGRTNLGGGMLKAEATDLRSIPICYNFEMKNEISAIYNSLRGTQISTDLSTTLNNPKHKVIDDIVLKHLELEKDTQYIISLLQDCVSGRMKKSKTK